MAIKLTRYVDITSGVGAGAVVPNRQLILREFSTNALIPTASFLSFTNADDVGLYFGTTSEEYKRAVFYFGFTSKNTTAPKQLDFASYTPTAVAPKIFGAKGGQVLGSYTSISNGSFGITLGGVTHAITSLDFTGAVSLAGVATVIQTALHAQTGTMWTASTVVFDSSRQSFDLTGGSTGPGNVAVTAGVTGTDVAGLLGWLSASAIFSSGAAAMSAVDTLIASTGSSNNFGSFGFVTALDLADTTAVAQWNLTQNVDYVYTVRVAVADAAAWSPALIGIGGVTLTLESPVANEYPEQFPAMILAATNYNARNSVQNYMYQQVDGLTPSVTTDEDADLYDGLRINYYGQTQTAGQFISFYQRGLMMGGSTDPLDQNVYANEIWFKDASAAAILTVLLSLPEIPANNAGRAQLLVILQSVIDLALLNGTIEAGKSLDTNQQLYISQVTGDPQAWKQVQNIGYWVDAQVVPFQNSSNVTEYKAVYTLVYSKNDVIRKVDGSNELI